MQVAINRKNTQFLPDSSRVIARFLFTTDARAIGTIQLVLGMTETEARLRLSSVLRDYSLRHRNISAIFERHFNKIAHLFSQINLKADSLDYNRRILIGSYG
jgi:hypothetical protein